MCFVDECNGVENGTDSSTDFDWLHFDDTKVKCLTSAEFHRKIADSTYDSPYILFYEKDEKRV
jgi:hypothetical protein